MPISLPRIVRIRVSSACETSTTPPSAPRSNRSSPLAISPPPNSTRRTSESDDTDLPDPDSPTTQRVSPGRMSKLTSSTPRTGPSLVWNSTRKFLNEASGWSSMGILGGTRLRDAKPQWRNVSNRTCRETPVAGARHLANERTRLLPQGGWNHLRARTLAMDPRRAPLRPPQLSPAFPGSRDRHAGFAHAQIQRKELECVRSVVTCGNSGPNRFPDSGQESEHGKQME